MSRPAWCLRCRRCSAWTVGRSAGGPPSPRRPPGGTSRRPTWPSSITSRAGPAWIEEGQAQEGCRADAAVAGGARQVRVPLFNPRSPCGLRPARSISSSSSRGFSRACALAVRRQSRPPSCGPTRPATAAPLRGPQPCRPGLGAHPVSPPGHVGRGAGQRERPGPRALGRWLGACLGGAFRLHVIVGDVRPATYREARGQPGSCYGGLLPRWMPRQVQVRPVVVMNDPDILRRIRDGLRDLSDC